MIQENPGLSRKKPALKLQISTTCPLTREIVQHNRKNNFNKYTVLIKKK